MLGRLQIQCKSTYQISQVFPNRLFRMFTHIKLHNTPCKQPMVCQPLVVVMVHCIQGNTLHLFLFLVLFSPCTVSCFTWCVWCRCVSQPCRCSRGGRSLYETVIQWTQSTSMGEISSLYSICMCSL